MLCAVIHSSSSWFGSFQSFAFREGRSKSAAARRRRSLDGACSLACVTARGCSRRTHGQCRASRRLHPVGRSGHADLLCGPASQIRTPMPRSTGASRHRRELWTAASRSDRGEFIAGLAVDKLSTAKHAANRDHCSWRSLALMLARVVSSSIRAPSTSLLPRMIVASESLLLHPTVLLLPLLLLLRPLLRLRFKLASRLPP